MEFPALPTDSAHKFLAVGCLVLSIACAFASYKLHEESAQRLSAQAVAMLNSAEFRQQMSEPSPRDQPPRNIAEARFRDTAEKMIHMANLPTSQVEKAAFWTLILAFVYQAPFFWSMFKWIQIQRVNDALAAVELATKMKALGVTLELKLPKKFRV
jgi:hypothetical protein